MEGGVAYWRINEPPVPANDLAMLLLAYFTAGLVSNTPISHFNKACIYSEQCLVTKVI